jgi:hypothetical protein
MSNIIIDLSEREYVLNKKLYDCDFWKHYRIPLSLQREILLFLKDLEEQYRSTRHLQYTQYIPTTYAKWLDIIKLTLPDKSTRVDIEKLPIELEKKQHIFLSDIGISSDYLKKIEFPALMWRALSALEQIAEEIPYHYVNSIINESSYLAVKVKYSSLSGQMIKIQSGLINFLSKLEIGPREIVKALSMASAIRTSLAEATKIIYLFPFFYSPSRRKHWGIIPYGLQLKISIILHEENPVYDHMLSLKKNFSSIEDWMDETSLKNTSNTQGLISKTRFSGSNGRIESLIIQMMKLTRRNKGTIYSFAGFIQEEILNYIIRATKDTEALQNFAIVSRVSDPLRMQELSEEILDNEDKKRNSIFAIDPLSSKQFETLLAEGFKVITFNHGQYIPVGIGFSVYLLPHLIKNNNWLSIKEQALKLLNPYLEPLKEGGIFIEEESTRQLKDPKGNFKKA